MEHSIGAEIRTITNKGAVKQLRVQGKIPAIVYGAKKEPIPIIIDSKAFHKEFAHVSESTLINLQITNGESKRVLIKHYERNYIRNNISHIDFYEVEAGKSLTTHVQIVPEGTPIGVKQDAGILEHFIHEIEIECLPKDLPENISINIEALQVGNSIHVSDLPAIAGVTYRSPSDQVLIHITAPKQASLVPDVGEIEDEDAEETKEEDA